MKEIQELFLHELKDIYDAEQRLVEKLPKIARQCTDPEVRQAFEEHAEETENQVERLKRVFKAIGKRPQSETCAGMAGILREQPKLVKEIDPPEHVLDLVNLGAGQKVEHYEISSYESLISMAETLGEDEAVDLLRENLMEEQAALEKLKSLEQDFDVEAAAERTRDEAPRKGGRGKGKKAPVRGTNEEGHRVSVGRQGGKARGSTSRRRK